ncbi:unnamed protein product [Gongylonema pulchrum]|uniref:Ran gtpase-activating protein n=1 Tax=Gongylonema pulchrum TaxID=637853 RepID=A0A183CWR6_9BILA|nr:unnamed protein product [Gongylonema pulchrum]
MEAKEQNGEWVLSFRDQQHKLNTEQDAEELAAAIENAPHVDVLELQGNTIGVGAGQRLAVALEHHPELKLSLVFPTYCRRLQRSFCDAMIRSGTALVELDLSDNAFGPVGAEGIEKFLESPSAYSLEVLKLNNNGLGAGGKVNKTGLCLWIGIVSFCSFSQ